MTPRFSRTPRTVPAGPMPTIDLMPAGEVERRARVGLMERWGWVIVAALAVTAVASAGAFYLQLSAEQRLTAESATTQGLLDELATLSDVSAAVATRSELTDFRSAAMASDVDWSRFLIDIGTAAPAGVLIAGFDLFPGGVPQTADPATEVGLTGQITFESSTPVDVAPTIRALRDTAGVTAVDGEELHSFDADGALSYNYVLTITFDQSIYTGEYAAPAGGDE